MNDTLTLPRSFSVQRDTRTVFRLLGALEGGRVELGMPDGSHHTFGRGEPGASMQVRDEACFTRVLTRGDIGLAEAYLDGQWESADVAGLLALFVRNRKPLERAVYGAWHHLLAARLRHMFHRNSRSGSRRNIMAHYDLGNAFYAKWLDSGMSYSAALFEGDAARSLPAAQTAKYRRILERLGARRGQQILEIGCGWGGFAELAVAHGLEATGLTLSPAQLEWAQQRVPQADLRLEDYRDHRGQYDHVVSIEMFEAVGERYWPAYFRAVKAALRRGGRAVVQSITIHEDLFKAYRSNTDFIQQYIFPGGMLPSRTAFRRAAARAGLVVHDEFAFGQDYARTLKAWREAFEARWEEIQPLGFDEHFHRLWRFYLCYCEAAFLTGNTDVVQFELRHG